MRLVPLFATLLLLAPAAPAAELFPFVLPWDDATPSVTSLSGWLEKPAGAHGFVTARDGHLYAGEKRLRIFGVNVAFGGNFPTHEDAGKVAARMAKFGINCVRFHHMDTSIAPEGILREDRKTLDPESLDRLDYFIAQLAKNGVYADLNLHVGNPYPGTPHWEGSTGYFKGVDNFYPPMIEAQQAYARALLTHVNPYTGHAYVNEPAVALIEINNENGLIMEWNNGALDHMPDPLAADLSRQWNVWLRKKYGDQAALAKAWSEGEEPLGEEMLKPFSALGEAWNLETHEDARAQISGEPRAEEGKDSRSLALRLEKAGPESWHVQLTQGGLAVTKGKTYTLELRAWADAPRAIGVTLSQAHAPWKVLASQKASLAPRGDKESAPSRLQLTFSPSESDENARISFSDFGATPETFHFAEASLRPGGIAALREGEALGKIPFFTKAQLNRRTLPARKDWNHFLFDTEAAYWPGMSRFIKEELGAHSLVLGSATGFSPWPVQAMLDVVDAHAYWQHPQFPHRDWDMNDWTVKDVPMAGAADGGTLPGLALRKVAGKPFIVTEYNHPAPNRYSSEAFLEVCAVAALQDWDGIFAFAYSHRGNQWDLGYFPSFFDIDRHPTKMATLPAALTLFYRADLRPNAPARIAGTTLEQAIESIRTGSSWIDGQALGLKREETFQHPVAMQIGESAAPTAPAAGDPGRLTWDTAAQRMLIVSPSSVGVVGKLEAGEKIDLGPVKITAGATRMNWATIDLTVLEGADFASAKRVLVTATGDTENTGMQWTSPEKNSVGTKWGQAPSRVEGIAATVTLPGDQAWKAWALDERGQRAGEVPVHSQGGNLQLELSPEHHTLWWELSRP